MQAGLIKQETKWDDPLKTVAKLLHKRDSWRLNDDVTVIQDLTMMLQFSLPLLYYCKLIMKRLTASDEAIVL